MGETSPESHWVPGHVRSYLRAMGFRLPLEDMEGHIAEWDRWMRSAGEFYDYRDTEGLGRVYEVHRRSIMPAMRVCRELVRPLVRGGQSPLSPSSSALDLSETALLRASTLPRTPAICATAAPMVSWTSRISSACEGSPRRRSSSRPPACEKRARRS